MQTITQNNFASGHSILLMCPYCSFRKMHKTVYSSTSIRFSKLSLDYSCSALIRKSEESWVDSKSYIKSAYLDLKERFWPNSNFSCTASRWWFIDDCVILSKHHFRIRFHKYRIGAVIIGSEIAQSTAPHSLMWSLYASNHPFAILSTITPTFLAKHLVFSQVVILRLFKKTSVNCNTDSKNSASL